MAESGVTTGAAEGFKWTEQDTEALIRWRTTNEVLFSGRRNAAIKGFEVFLKDHGLEGRVEPGKIKRKWENLKQKYKELKAPRTGISTEGGEATAASWRWFNQMDEALGRRPSISPPVTIDSSNQDEMVASPPSPEAGTSSRKRRRPEWVDVLCQVTERDEERERLCLEREERREREALDREERKEKERLERKEKMHREQLEREEKRERERLEREDKRERERLDREEKREREWRVWLERREQEIAAREERRQKDLMAVIEKMLK